MDIKKIVSKIKVFEPQSFFEWINVISLHPSNQKYLGRFEVVISTLFSIKENEFGNQKATRESIICFFNEFESEFGNDFCFLEDFEPFNQNQLIPLFLNGEKFYFYYGLIENPFSRWNTFLEFALNISDKDNTFKTLYNHLLFSLRLQTKTLNALSQLEESSKINNKKIYVPTLSFYKKIKEVIKLETYQTSNFCRLGLFKSNQNKIFENCYNANLPKLYQSFIANIKDTSYFFLPQIHLELISNLYQEEILKQKDSDIKILLKKSLLERVDRKCIKFFSIYQKVLHISLSQKNQEDALEKFGIANCVLIDNNKLLIFKSVGYGSIEQEIKIAKKELKDFNKEIKSKDMIGIFKYSNKEMFGISPKDLEVWYILVYEEITFNSLTITMTKKDSLNTHIVNLAYLDFVFEKLLDYRAEAPLQFIKYIKNDKDFLNNGMRTITTGYLDKFASYIAGESFYSRAGKLPNYMIFAPFDGNEFESNYYFTKYEDCIHEIFEKKFPKSFNVIESIDNNIYRGVDVSFISVIYAIKNKDYPVFICVPQEVDLPNEFDELLKMVFPKLFCFHLDSFFDKFIELLKSCNVYPTPYTLLITSNSIVNQEENELHFLADYASMIQEEEPCIMVTKMLKNGEIRTFIIFNTENQDAIFTIFKSDDNTAERYLLKELIKSILRYGKEQNQDKISQSFIDNNLKLGKKRFNITALPTNNPQLNKYRGFIKTNTSDIAKVNKEFAEYLANKTTIQPGKYFGDAAKQINLEIYNYLQGLLENKLKDFNDTIIVYAYQQLELIQGAMESNELQYGIDKDLELNYDLVEKAQEELSKTTRTSAFVKHCIHTILKLQPNGNKYITENDWTYILSITAALIETSQIYEYINYDINPRFMEITDLYEISTHEVNNSFDFEQMQIDLAKSKIELGEKLLNAAQDNYPLNTSNSENSKTEELLDRLDKLLIKKLGYDLSTQMNVFYALYRFNLHSRNYFPVTIVSKNDLVKYLSEAIDDISIDEIQKILNDSTISYSTFDKDDKLIPSDMIIREKRINLCPIINIGDDKYIYGNQHCNFARIVWMQSILEGDFPYKIEDNEIEELLNEIHKINSKDLEYEIETVLKEVISPKYLKRSLKKFNEISKELPKDAPCGEIDLLCANPNNHTIFVLEAKSLLQKNRPIRIKQSFSDFFDDKPKGKRYYYKLNKKYEFVRDNLDKFITYFGLDNSEEWKVKKAFIVDKRIFAAYNTDFEIDFIFLNDLQNFINKT